MFLYCKKTFVIVLVLCLLLPKFILAYSEQRKFTGYEHDDLTGLEYAGGRYYNSKNGKFVSEDPAFLSTDFDLTNPQEMNSYSYTGNNPLRYIDPNGEKRVDYAAPKVIPTVVGQPSGTYKGVQLYAGNGKYYPHNAQCVVGVQNLYYNLFGVDLKYKLGSARNYADLRKVSNGSIDYFPQGSVSMPQENDIITWDGGDNGHIGMIIEVNFDSTAKRGKVYTVEQNYSMKNQVFENKLEAKVENDGKTHYYIESRSIYKPMSWQRPSDGRTLPYTFKQPWENKTIQAVRKLINK